MNPPEDCPTDPYNDRRKEASALRTFKTPSDFDKLRQFLEMDRKVLRFYCVWDDRDCMFGEMRKFVIHVSFINSKIINNLEDVSLMVETTVACIISFHCLLAVLLGG